MLSPMKINTRLPLAALEAFEAVGTRLSFRQAASDLGVSQSALSRHVDNLEARFQVQLFMRQGRGVALTPAGERLLLSLSDALGQIRSALRALDAERKHQVVVSLLPSFALNWLIPRWDQLQRALPNLDISLRPELRVCDLKKGEADLALRYSAGPSPGLATTSILSEEIAPVCSPSLDIGALEGVEKYRAGKLLDVANRIEWDSMLKNLKVPHRDTQKNRVVLHDYNLVLGAALEGRGIAIGRRSMIESHLRSGQLIKLTRSWYRSPYSYYAVTLPNRKCERDIRMFIEWLVSQGSGRSNEAL